MPTNSNNTTNNIVTLLLYILQYIIYSYISSSHYSSLLSHYPYLNIINVENSVENNQIYLKIFA